MHSWNNISKIPKINCDDRFGAKYKISKRLVVRVIDHNGKFCGYSFAKYYYEDNTWRIEGYLGSYFVTHWFLLTEPKINTIENV